LFKPQSGTRLQSAETPLLQFALEANRLWDLINREYDNTRQRRREEQAEELVAACTNLPLHSGSVRPKPPPRGEGSRQARTAQGLPEEWREINQP